MIFQTENEIPWPYISETDQGFTSYKILRPIRIQILNGCRKFEMLVLFLLTIASDLVLNIGL